MICSYPSFVLLWPFICSNAGLWLVICSYPSFVLLWPFICRNAGLWLVICSYPSFVLLWSVICRRHYLGEKLSNPVRLLASLSLAALLWPQKHFGLFYNSVFLLSDIIDIITFKNALKWGMKKRRERTRIQGERGERRLFKPSAFPADRLRILGNEQQEQRGYFRGNNSPGPSCSKHG